MNYKHNIVNKKNHEKYQLWNKSISLYPTAD